MNFRRLPLLFCDSKNDEPDRGVRRSVSCHPKNRTIMKAIRLALALALAFTFTSASVFAQTTNSADAAPKEAAILTPQPSPAPPINGAKVFGVRPGNPFLFTIAATGERPMTYAADGLPAGLKVDSS